MEILSTRNVDTISVGFLAINQHILLYYNLYGGDGDGADGDGDGDGDDKICRFLGNKSTYLVV